jgi:methionyl-tRNA synthetase
MARILITSAIPYINGIKHLGNLVGSQLPADLFARFNRAMGHEVMFICATDEHGTPAELAAAKAGQTGGGLLRRNAQGAKDRQGLPPVLRPFRPLVQPAQPPPDPAFRGQAGRERPDRGSVEKQVFSIDDNRFLPDRYITGTCPNCGYEAARGDQCENCTKQLDPTDLINPRSSISGSTNLEVRETKHLYLKQRA